MNLREGTRRLALLLGAVRTILGGFASYLELQSALNQRERHNKFERMPALRCCVIVLLCHLPQFFQVFEPAFSITKPPTPDSRSNRAVLLRDKGQ
jgi:hypothetical protein